MTELRTWKTALATIEEVAHDHSLHAFEVYRNSDNRLVSTVVPADLDAMQDLIHALDAGECPIYDKWEDGNGNQVSDLTMEDKFNHFLDGRNIKDELVSIEIGDNSIEMMDGWDVDDNDRIIGDSGITFYSAADAVTFLENNNLLEG